MAIAHALANDPPVILADEPTANLDSAIGRRVARLLRQLATQDRRAVVIVSHDTRLEEIADRVLWLEDGTSRELAIMATGLRYGRGAARPAPPATGWCHVVVLLGRVPRRVRHRPNRLTHRPSSGRPCPRYLGPTMDLRADRDGDQLVVWSL